MQGKASAASVPLLKSAPKVSREARLQWLDAQIRDAKFPDAPGMMEVFDITRRTVFNDIHYLRHTLNAPLVFDRTRNGWRYTEPYFALPFLQLTQTEAAALRRALLAASEFLGDDDAQSLRRVTERFAPFLPAVAPIATETVGGALQSFRQERLGELITMGNHSIARRQKWQILYNGAHRGDVSERIIHPLHLHNQQGEWYMVAYCEWRAAPRTFALSRIEEWQRVGEEAAFRRPPNFDAPAFLAQALSMMHGGELEHVVIAFDAYQARWIRERQYHPTQTIEELPDGGLLLSFEVTGLSEVKRWVMAYGSHATVRQPAALRQDIAREIAALKKNYEKF